jgi:hypothetical protein
VTGSARIQVVTGRRAPARDPRSPSSPAATPNARSPFGARYAARAAAGRRPRCVDGARSVTPIGAGGCRRTLHAQRRRGSAAGGARIGRWPRRRHDHNGAARARCRGGRSYRAPDAQRGEALPADQWADGGWIIGPQTLKALGVYPEAAHAQAASADSLLQRIAACESGGDPTAVSASGRYRGKYQFDRATWRRIGGRG